MRVCTVVHLHLFIRAHSHPGSFTYFLQGGHHPTPSRGSSGSSGDGVKKGDVFPGGPFPGKMEQQRGGGGGGPPPPLQGQQPQHPKLLERASLPAELLWNQQHPSQLLSANRDDSRLTLTIREVINVSGPTCLKLNKG